MGRDRGDQLPLPLPTLSTGKRASARTWCVRSTSTADDPGANKVIDTTEFVDRKIAAIAEHRSQVVFLVEGILSQVAMAGLDLKVAWGNPEPDRVARVGVAQPGCGDRAQSVFLSLRSTGGCVTTIWSRYARTGRRDDEGRYHQRPACAP